MGRRRLGERRQSPKKARKSEAGKDDASGKDRKDSQLLIRISRQERDDFLRLCASLDTTAAREVRRFIREFTQNGGEGARR